MLKWPAGHFEFLQQAIGESNSFEGPVDRPCPGEQSLSIDGNAVGHLFQVRDDLEVQTASMRVRMLLEAFDQGSGIFLMVRVATAVFSVMVP